MKRFPATVVMALFLSSMACLCAAEPLRTYVSDFNVAGVPDGDKLKVSLNRMLASRLNPTRVQLVSSQNKADLLIDGSLTQYGKNFSLDVLLTRPGSGAISKVFEQGEGQDAFLGAFGRLMEKIDRELAAMQVTAPVADAKATSSVPVTVLSKSDIPGVKPALQPADATGKLPYAVTSVTAAESASAVAELPLEGVYKGIALGRKLDSGEREIFLTGDHVLRWYVQGKDLRLVAEVAVPIPAYIVAIDSADLDGDGIPELYVSVLDRGAFSSEVFRAENGKLVKIAEHLPWGFRGTGVDMKTRVIYGQKFGSGGELLDHVAVLGKSGNQFTERETGKLPSFGSVYNFVRLKSNSGEDVNLVLDADGHPIASSPDGKEVWRGEQVLGGSETILVKKDEQINRVDNYNWTFMEQRMLILPDGTLLVPRNEGTFSFGNNRAYNRHTMHAFQWTGARLVEKWHSREMSSYLADFAFDAGANEVVLLEITQKSSFFGKGKTVISTRVVD